MGGYEYALGPIAWILTDGLRQIGGRCATALFGNSAELLTDGTRPLPLVPGIRTGGGTAFAGDAIELVSDQLEMTNPRRPRFVYVLSDGGWSDTRAGVERIRWLAEHGVPTIHLAIGIAPLSVECDRIIVITDPAEALDHIAADTVAALARPPAPPAQPLTNLSHERNQPHARHPTPPCCPRPALFDVTTVADGAARRARIERVALERPRARPQRAPRDLPRGHRAARRDADAHRPARAVHRPPPRPRPADRAPLRRPAPLLAAQASHELAGTDGLRRPRAGPQPDRRCCSTTSRAPDEIRRIQAQANQREELTLVDQQAAVRRLLGGPRRPARGRPDRRRLRRPRHLRRKRAHNLRRQLTLPEPIRARVAERPTGEQLSVTMANRLADMHEIAPAAHRGRRQADHHHRPARQARCATSARSCTAPSSRTSTPTPSGSTTAPCSTPPSRSTHARAHLDRRRPTRRSPAILGCEPERARRASSTRSPPAPRAGRSSSRSPARCATAPATAATPTSTTAASDFAAGIWVVDPVFMLDLVHEQLGDDDDDAGPRGRRTSPAPASTTTSCATPPPRTSSAARRRAPATPRRPAATSGSATTSAPG